MESVATRRLTERQREVMERIDRRVPIKTIAEELDLSETRINQHIRALKDIYGAGKLNDLVEKFRASDDAGPPAKVESANPTGTSREKASRAINGSQANASLRLSADSDARLSSTPETSGMAGTIASTEDQARQTTNRPAFFAIVSLALIAATLVSVVGEFAATDAWATTTGQTDTP